MSLYLHGLLVFLRVLWCPEEDSNFMNFCLNADTYFDSEIYKRSQKRSRFMHQIRVTSCGLLPKLDGLAGLLPARSGLSRQHLNAAVRPVIADIHRVCKIGVPANSHNAGHSNFAATNTKCVG
jgi:hypothetical protein